MLSKINSNKGFTVIELVVVIGLIAILAAIAAPNLLKRLPEQRLKAAAKEIYSAFQQARLSAVQENENVVIRFTPVAYTPEGGVGTYELFLDNGTGAAYQNWSIDGGERLLATNVMPAGTTLVSALFTDGAVNAASAGFDGRGLPAGSFIGDVQLRTSAIWYRITLSPAGNIKMEKSSDGITWSI